MYRILLVNKHWFEWILKKKNEIRLSGSRREFDEWTKILDKMKTNARSTQHPMVRYFYYIISPFCVFCEIKLSLTLTQETRGRKERKCRKEEHLLASVLQLMSWN